MDCSDETTWIYLCTEVMIDEDKVTDMLNFLGRLGAIDKDLWAVDKIIWCQNFTDRLAGVFEKRKLTKPENRSLKWFLQRKQIFPHQKCLFLQQKCLFLQQKCDKVK